MNRRAAEHRPSGGGSDPRPCDDDHARPGVWGDGQRPKHLDAFTPWLEQMEGCGIAPFERRARGMRQDETAIRAARTLPWSNGPVEGTINWLKMIKRSMYDSVGEFPPSSVRQ